MSDRDIRFARHGEEAQIIRFLHDHWDAKFSVVQSRRLFDYLYQGPDGPNFVLAFDGDALVGTLGLTFYDDTRRDVFLTLWRSIDTKVTTGTDMIKFAQAQGYDSLSSVGTRKEVLIFYKLLKFKTGPMDQFVRINPNLTEAKILDGPIPSGNAVKGAGVVSEVAAFDPAFTYFATGVDGSPFKSLCYLKKRYFAHPFYQYQVYEVRDGGQVQNYFVTRRVEAEGTAALRLVDCVAGSAGIGAFSDHVSGLFEAKGYEFVDVYSLNLDAETMKAAGFVNCADYPDLVVPNYYEPFMRESEVKYFVTDLDAPLLFKGDGDADRPYRLPAEEI